MARIANKVALLSGAARGMGHAQAVLFAREGARLLLGDVRADETERLADAINVEAGAQIAVGLHLDVTSEEQWAAAIRQGEALWDGVDILVNNAGIVTFGDAQTASVEDWNRTVAVNQTGTWLGMKTVVGSMRRRGGGSIVNISSIGGLVGTPDYAAYHATKGAVRMLAKHGAVAFGADNIRCNTVFPGPIATDMLTELVPTAEAEAMLAATCPLKRIGRAEEIAAAVLFLASDESSFVTGADLAVDGGLTAA